MIDFKPLKLRSKFASIGTNKLATALGSRVTVEIDFYVHLEIINADLAFGDGDNVIYSNGTYDFILAGFKPGMIIVVDTVSDVNDGTYEIISVTSNALFVAEPSSGSGSSSTSVEFTEELTVVGDIHDTTPVTAIDYYFGLVKNGDSASYNSLLDGEEQKYRKTGLDATAMNTYALDIFNTNKSWVTGTTTEQALTTIEETGVGTSGASYGYEQCFRISHTFHVSPAVLRAWEDANENLDVSLIDWLYQSASIYFVPRIVAGWSPSGSEHTSDNGNIASVLQDGDVGFYGEYRNGGTPNYTISTPIAYASSTSDVLEQLSINDVTTFEFTIAKATGNFGVNHRFDVYVFVVPDDADVQNNGNDVWTNFDVSNVFQTEGAGTISHNRIASCVVDYTDATHAKVTCTYTGHTSMEGKKFFIFVDVGELNSDQATNDQHTLDVAYGDFAKYIDTDDLIVTPGIKINEHSTNDEGKAYTDKKGWIEDGILATMYFDIAKLTGLTNEYGALIDTVEFSIDCEHQTDSTRNFNLESVSIPLPSNTTRGFQLYTGDPKNYKILEELTGDADYRKYKLQCATKLRWEEWSIQANADPDFSNPNANWSAYDFPPDWKIYLNIKINVNLEKTSDATDTETFQYIHKANIRIKDYEEYSGCEKIGLIETFHAVTGANLNGKLAPNANTLVKYTVTGKSLFPCIYENITSGSGECEYEQLSSGSGSFAVGDGDISTCPEYYGILELYKPNSGNALNIRQISTLWDTETGSPWIGPVATNKAAIIAYPYASPPRIEVYATLDVTQLQTTSQYYVSGRLGRAAQTICDASIMDYLPHPILFYSNLAITGFTEAELLIFVESQEITVMNEISSIVGDTVTFTSGKFGGIKIVCSVDAIEDVTAGDTYTNAALVGLTIQDFLFFQEFDGLELTTVAGTGFNSGTGTILGTAGLTDIKITFHASLFSANLVAATTYTDNLLIGLTEADVMIFCNGIEYTHLGATISGNTITFPSALTGRLKVCKVNP